MGEFRIEKDSLGEVPVPAEAYYGAQTQRAVENYPISGVRHPRHFVLACAYIKKAAALANRDVGNLEPRLAEAIAAAADRVLAGEFADQFVVDVYNSGAGTSFHMNVNEVLANVAIEGLGGQRGDYRLVHPNDHVNYGQSTNDVIPTATRLAALLMLRELMPALDRLVAAFRGRAEAFDGIIKAGRTHLQDAVPVRLGQEFGAYAVAVAKAARAIEAAGASCAELGIGGSATGTGINTHPEYADRTVAYLCQHTGLDLRPAPDRFEAMQSQGPVVQLSAALRGLAVELIRIANDLRLLASGPTSGLAEILLPSAQPGSSIMPGKVNPSIPEMLNMVCFGVLGNDLTVATAAQAGQLELNVMMPVIAYRLLDSLLILTNAIAVFTKRCVEGIQADAARCRAYAERTLGLATALNPYIGYRAAAEVVKESLATGRAMRDIILAKGLLGAQELDRILDPRAMTEPKGREGT
ncbi:MAG TPA: aspartate ammonia-lyase [Planctomycetota bacterium]|nr:aspartate ammonia-lyase [Planctomycetota bacterium]HRR78628.1 aspartate ammonia-lyase [Planctomycetota bacterium]